jgi:hypothetical protein
MSMSDMRFPVAVIVRRTPLSNRWVSERWDPIAVEPETGASPTSTPVLLSDDAEGACWRFAGYAIELHRSEAEGYFLNISSEEPRIFVMWRDNPDSASPAIRPELVTVSYNEAARLLDGGERVDTVPMRPEVLQWMVPFVVEHYKPEPKRKVRRNDPFADGGAKR